MIKKTVFIIVFGTITTFSFYAIGPYGNSLPVHKGLNKDCKLQGEEIFNTHVKECLVVMEAIARKYSEKGVAVISFVPGEQTASWNSRMRVVGTLSTETHNFLAVASAKSAEMALTLENSGSGIRPPLVGELGYKGGVIKKVKCGYLIASFSGAPAEIDAEISKAGVDFLFAFY